MTDDELTPPRLDQLMDGEPPVTDDERDVLALAAQLRAEVPQPSPQLRTRITALGDQPARHTARRSPRWSSAPALGALVAVLIGGGVAVKMMNPDRAQQSTDIQVASDRSAPAGSESAQADGGQAPDSTARSSSSKQLSGASQMEQSQVQSTVSSWQLPAIAIDDAVTALRAIARDRQLTIQASSTDDTTTVELELPADDARVSVVAAVTEVLAAHDGVADSGPITLAPGQAVLTIALTDARG